VIFIFPIDSNETKKFLSRIYNDVSKDLFGMGTTMQKVTVDGNVISIQAKHRRSPRSAVLEGEVPSLKQEVDFHLSLLYKKKLMQKLNEETEWDIEAVLRDYDSATQLAFTNIVLKQK
jgi:hypothetical protein